MVGAVAVVLPRRPGLDRRASAARRRRSCCRARRSAAGATPCPALVSYVLLVGWETVLVALSTLATATVFERLGWSHGNAHQDRRVRGGRGGDRARRDHGLRPDHAAAEVPHDRADRRHRRLRRPHLGPHPPRHAAGHPERRHQRGDRRRGPGDDRVRGRLGEHRRRLLPLPPARRLHGRRRVVADVRREPAGGDPGDVRRPAGRVVAEAERRHRQRPDRRADHDPADVVPAAVRDRRRRSDWSAAR